MKPKSTCTGTRRDGQPCRGFAMRWQDRCHQHGGTHEEGLRRKHEHYERVASEMAGLHVIDLPDGDVDWEWNLMEAAHQHAAEGDPYAIEFLRTGRLPGLA